MLYAGDLRWWTKYGGEVEASFPGERLTSAKEIDGVNYIEAVDDVGLCTKPGRINTGGNAGYQAINLAYAWGAKRIILLGYDMQVGPKGEKHHHSDHSGGLPNPTDQNLREWARRMIELGSDLRRMGVQVINASRRTAIGCFERLPIEIALADRSARTVSLQIPQKLLPKEHAAFEAGITAAGYQLTDKAEVSIVWGGRTKASGTVLVAENGYLDGPGGPYVALSVGGHNGSGRGAVGGPERLQRLGVKLKPWRVGSSLGSTPPQHILLCPSRGLTTAYMPQPEGWVESVTAELRQYTDRPIRVRPHPGNYKVSPPKVSLEDDLRNAWACVIWNSAAGVKALIEGVPVFQCAPHWICTAASSLNLAMIEDPAMDNDRRVSALEKMASAQWTLDEIASGAPFRELLGLTVLCVLKSGGDYDAEYVRKLRDGVARNLTIPHRFVCLSDVPVPCERIPLKHGWKGWWSKVEIFRPDVITGPAIYLDLDTIIVGNIDSVASIPYDFAMLNVREKDVKIGNSGAMWMAKPFPHVYERFAEKPDYWIDFHVKHAHDRYMGDQAWISDQFETIPKLNHALPGVFKSYKYDRCQEQIPQGCAVVCFGGPPRPHQAGGWVRQAWV